MPAVQRTRPKSNSRAAAGARLYAVQGAYVNLLFGALPSVLATVSECDPEIAREVGGYREGYAIGFAILGEDMRMCVGVRDGRFVPLPSAVQPDLQIVFKHVNHAFNVFTFRETTAQAYARERMVVHGDVGAALRFVRCLSRALAVLLPRFAAERALKGLPDITEPEKRRLASTVYTRLLRSLVARN